jgi:hypothetical protein
MAVYAYLGFSASDRTGSQRGVRRRARYVRPRYPHRRVHARTRWHLPTTLRLSPTTLDAEAGRST